MQHGVLVAQGQQFGVLAQVSPHHHSNQTEQTAHELVQHRQRQHPTMILDWVGHEERRSGHYIEFPSLIGFCLRAPAQGSCAYANICEHCPNFRTDRSFFAVLSTQRVEALAADAEARGWTAEAARHHRLIERLDQLITHAGSEQP